MTKLRPSQTLGSMQKIAHFIHGKKVAPLSGQYLENVNPATGQVFSFLPRGSKDDVDAAVRAADLAFSDWSTTRFHERANFLRMLAKGIESRKREFAELESRDQGKPVALAENMDINRAVLNFNFFADLIDSEFKNPTKNKRESTNRGELATSYTTFHPVGIAGLISPWNLPLYLLTWKIAPALACGNTVVCKPSEFTSMTADLLAEIAIDIGLPQGVLNIVYGLGPEVGQAIVDHPKIPLISFTGGTVTGKRIASSAANHLKKLSLELGGKNPNIIFADCDLDQAIETSLRSSFLNQGEICLCGSRILVDEKIYDQFVKEFVAKAKQLRVGDPFSADTFMGALISKDHLEKVKSFVALAKKDGAEILCGGKSPEFADSSPFVQGYWYLPTVITGLKQDSRCIQEEIFGPVVSIQKFKDINEAIDLANDTSYGLSASIWTNNPNTTELCAQKLNVGTVWVNTWLHRDLTMPFGGAKQSGIGREGGVHSLEFFSELKTVCIRNQ